MSVKREEKPSGYLSYPGFPGGEYECACVSVPLAGWPREKVRIEREGRAKGWD